jgi:nucleoside-diphosphate-sugar epimerase
MKVLIIGGTGLISQGILKHLLLRNADVTQFNRGRREAAVPSEIRTIIGDRNDPAALRRAAAAATAYDVVIDMVCFDPSQAHQAVEAFAGRCQQFIFCSTVCTYGVKVPPGVFVDETFPQQPISGYGRNKVACEQIFLEAHAAERFKATIVRPSHTYGPGSPLIDNLETDPVAWDRIERGQPVLCAGDGLGIWVSTHRDDCGKLFAHAAMNPLAFGQAYNATRRPHLTWRDYYATVAAVLGKPARLLFMPADWIARHDPARFGLLREITAFHGAFDSSRAERDIPEFRCEIDLASGAAQTLDDARRRGAWKTSVGDATYQQMVDEATSIGIQPEEA